MFEALCFFIRTGSPVPFSAQPKCLAWDYGSRFLPPDSGNPHPEPLWGTAPFSPENSASVLRPAEGASWRRTVTPQCGNNGPVFSSGRIRGVLFEQGEGRLGPVYAQE